LREIALPKESEYFIAVLRVVDLTRTSPVLRTALRVGTGASSEVSLLRSASGGTIVGEVTSNPVGDQPYLEKQIARVVYEAFSIEVGGCVPPALFDWIAKSWDSDPPASDGAILRADAYFNVASEVDFNQAFVAATTFPSFDAASSSNLLLTVRLMPTSVQPEKKPDTDLKGYVGHPPKPWLPANFLLTIDGVDCTKVSRIDGFTVERQIDVVVDDAGQPAVHVGLVAFPNLRIVLGSAAVATWSAWYEDFVIRGHNDAAFEKTGSIRLLAADMQTVLIRLDLFGLGIFRLVPLWSDKGPDVVPRYEADLYCQHMTLSAVEAFQ